jgi:hypothetical protein
MYRPKSPSRQQDSLRIARREPLDKRLPDHAERVRAKYDSHQSCRLVGAIDHDLDHSRGIDVGDEAWVRETRKHGHEQCAHIALTD